MTDTHQNLQRAMDYLREVIHLRMKDYLNQSKSSQTALELPPFALEESDDFFTQFVSYSEPTIEEFITFMLALVPHLVPGFFEQLIGQYFQDGSDFIEFGGTKSGNTRYMMPTVGTALFVVAGEDISRRIQLMTIFKSDHFFIAQNILKVEEAGRGEPLLSSRLVLEEDYVELLTTGNISIPKLSTSFPAQQIATNLEWDDLVVNENTLSQLRQIEIWMKHHEALMNDWGMARKLRPGYRALFYGPPGTGKTLAASLIGKYTEMEVLRVDLSQIVSKYIGETEKNLANLFDKAENKGWCLFFDEADACFGKRSATKDARDRYANQEVSYLLQRIENYAGLVIMATNFKSNIDEAFLRRFNAVINFPLPRSTERYKLWSKAFPEQVNIATTINLTEIAGKYELSGSNIMNVVQYACLQALSHDSNTIEQDYLLDGITKEFEKEGRIVN